MKVGIRPGAGTDTLASPKIKISEKNLSNDNDKILQWQFDKFFSLLNKAENYLSGGGVKELKVGIRPGAGTDTLASPKVRVAVTSSGILNDTLL